MQLFPDQEELIAGVRAAFKNSKAVLMQSATGSGKTAMATDIINRAKNKNSRICFTVPRTTLLEQTSQTFTKLGIPHSFIASGHDFNPTSNIYIGMVDTMARRLDRLPELNMMIGDEIHFGEGSVDKVINHYKQKGAYILGLSATPYKMSGKGLDCWFDTMVEGKPISWLIENKRLSGYKYFRGQTKIDLARIPKTNGEYAQKQLAEYMEQQDVIIGDCVKDYAERSMGKLHLVRCASIKASQRVAEKFRAAGIPAMHVDGKTSASVQKQIFLSFAKRELLVLTFSDLLTFGFDLSQASGMNVCVESGSDLKPTESLVSIMQWWGRLLRAKDEPATINDHVNNCLKHGLPDDDRKWSLAGAAKDKKKADDEGKEFMAKAKQCPKCFWVHKPALICPRCQHVYEINSRDISNINGQLVEFTKEMRIITPDEYKALKEQIDEMVKRAVAKRRMPLREARDWATAKASRELLQRKMMG